MIKLWYPMRSWTLQYVVQSAHYMLVNSQYSLFTVQCSLHNEHYIIYTNQYTMYIEVHCNCTIYKSRNRNTFYYIVYTIYCIDGCTTYTVRISLNGCIYIMCLYTFVTPYAYTVYRTLNTAQ